MTLDYDDVEIWDVVDSRPDILDGAGKKGKKKKAVKRKVKVVTKGNKKYASIRGKLYSLSGDRLRQAETIRQLVSVLYKNSGKTGTAERRARYPNYRVRAQKTGTPKGVLGKPTKSDLTPTPTPSSSESGIIKPPTPKAPAAEEQPKIIPVKMITNSYNHDLDDLVKELNLTKGNLRQTEEERNELRQLAENVYEGLRLQIATWLRGSSGAWLNFVKNNYRDAFIGEDMSKKQKEQAERELSAFVNELLSALETIVNRDTKYKRVKHIGELLKMKKDYKLPSSGNTKYFNDAVFEHILSEVLKIYQNEPELRAVFETTSPVEIEPEVVDDDDSGKMEEDKPKGASGFYGAGMRDPDITWSDELQKLTGLLPDSVGAIPMDKALKLTKKTRPMTAIVNTAYSNQPGAHWVGLIVEPHDQKVIMYCDSFGRDPDAPLYDNLKRMAKRDGLQLKINRVPHQPIEDQSCGWYCLEFLKNIFINKMSFKEATGFDQMNQDDIERLKDQIKPFM